MLEFAYSVLLLPKSKAKKVQVYNCPSLYWCVQVCSTLIIITFQREFVFHTGPCRFGFFPLTINTFTYKLHFVFLLFVCLIFKFVC